MKVLLADAHILSQEGLKALSNRSADLELVGVVNHSAALRTFLPKAEPDTVIIDLTQKDKFDIHDLHHINNRYPSTKILGLLSYMDKKSVKEALNEDIHGLLLKSCGEDEFLAALNSIYHGDKTYCSSVVEMIMHERNNTGESDALSLLSEREKEIVSHIAAGLSSEEIAKELFLSFHTVRTHRRNIMKKLGVKSSSQLVMFAVRNGLVEAEA